MLGSHEELRSHLYSSSSFARNGCLVGSLDGLALSLATCVVLHVNPQRTRDRDDGSVYLLWSDLWLAASAYSDDYE